MKVRLLHIQSQSTRHSAVSDSHIQAETETASLRSHNDWKRAQAHSRHPLPRHTCFQDQSPPRLSNTLHKVQTAECRDPRFQTRSQSAVRANLPQTGNGHLFCEYPASQAQDPLPASALRSPPAPSLALQTSHPAPQHQIFLRVVPHPPFFRQLKPMRPDKLVAPEPYSLFLFACCFKLLSPQ